MAILFKLIELLWVLFSGGQVRELKKVTQQAEVVAEKLKAGEVADHEARVAAGKLNTAIERLEHGVTALPDNSAKRVAVEADLDRGHEALTKLLDRLEGK